MENLLGQVSRHRMLEIWEYVKQGDIKHFYEEDADIARILDEHREEFYDDFEAALESPDIEYDPDTESNPFMHIIIHSIVENQLRDKDPIQVYQFFNAMRKNKVSRHESVHLVGCILSALIYEVLKEKKQFNKQRYERLLTRYKNRKPDKIYTAADRGFE